MTLNPFDYIELNYGIAARRKAEGFARDGMKLAAAYLVHRGWLSEEASPQAIELVSGFALFAYGQYASWKAKDHTEDVIDVAQAASPQTPRSTIEIMAKESK